MSEIGTLRIYGAGGCGINIASSFDSSASKVEIGHSCPLLTYIDTSKSNLSDTINPEHIALIQDIDGSGKVRRENSELISRNIKSIIQNFPPGDFNVVVFSASGGSGSVFAPLIMAELLNRGCSVVGIVVGSDESNITSQNTLNTLKSLEAIAQKTSSPVVIHYNHNSRDVTRSAVDAECRSVIAALSALASKQNAELDSRDIANWVRFDRSTSARPQLAIFDVFRYRNTLEEQNDTPISIASLFNNTDAMPLNKTPEYHCAGYPRHAIEGCDELHFVISLEDVPRIYKMIQSRVQELDKLREARVSHESIVSPTEIDTVTGLVL